MFEKASYCLWFSFAFLNWLFSLLYKSSVKISGVHGFLIFIVKNKQNKSLTMTITTYSNVTTYTGKLSQSYKIHDESTLLADFELDSATRLSSVICTQLKCSAAITD